MRNDLEIHIKPNARFTCTESVYNDIILYTVEMSLESYINVDKLRGYKWDLLPSIEIDRYAVLNKHNLDVLNELIEVITIGHGCKPIHTHITNVSAIENIICNNYPTVETYFNQLPLLENGETNYWYLSTSKADTMFSIDNYVMALNKYTEDHTWHVSDITEHDKQHVVYEFTNTYDDLYY